MHFVYTVCVINQLKKKKKCITALTSARLLSLSRASSIQVTHPHPTCWRSILILSSHLRLGIPSGLFPSGFPNKILYILLFYPIRATCPVHLILLDFITRPIFGEQYRSLSYSLCSFLHSPVTSSLLGPNIPLNTLFPNTLNLRSSLNVSDQVSHPYKTTGGAGLREHRNTLSSLTFGDAINVYRNAVDHRTVGNHLVQQCALLKKHPVYR